jgi:hypothetical protein
MNTGTTVSAEANLVLLVTNSRQGDSTDSAIIVVKHRNGGVDSTPVLHVGMLSHANGVNAMSIGPDSFKLISNGWNTGTELWLQKKLPWGRFVVYEISRAISDFTGDPVTYHANSAWQTQSPVGTAANVISRGVTVSGVNLISTPVSRQTGSAFYEPLSTYTASAGQVVPVDATFNDFTVKLPSAPPNGSVVTVQRVDAEPLRKVTVVRQGSDTINLTGGQTSYTLAVPSQTAVFQFHGGVWRVISDSSQPSKIFQVYGSPADRLISRMTLPPTDTRRQIIEALIADLSQCGVWDKLDALYLFAAHSAQAARLNWKSSTVADATSVNSPLFTVDRGFTGDGGTSFLDTNTPASEYVKYAANDATLGVYVRNSVSLNANDIASTPYSHITVGASNNIVVRVNSSTFFNGDNAGDRTGLFAASRLTGANTGFAYKDGQPAGSGAQSAGIESDIPFQFLRGGDVFSTRQLAAGFWGAGLTAAEHSDLNTALAIYMTSIGAAV